MKLEVVTVCVNYADFLAHTLPSVCTQVDNMVVVTSPKDKETQALCSFYGVRCIQTNVFYEDGDVFNKGKGICEGLKQLDMDGWVVHMDADIYLPPTTRKALDNVPLDPCKIYGVDRLMCQGYEKWVKFIQNPKPIHSSGYLVHLGYFPVGARLVKYKDPGQGYEPIGFFQLWNPKGSNVYEYPKKHGAADKTDVIHAKKWPREKRELLPEVVVIHLATTQKIGANWNGRTSPRFGNFPLPCGGGEGTDYSGYDGYLDVPS
jgi:hypothetical protein